MFDDRVCPSCQVVLPDGRTICPKCGTKVEPSKTGLWFIDKPRQIYSALVEDFGPVGAGIATGIVLLLILALLIGSFVIGIISRQ
jgi:hypothetical protein